MSLLFRPWASVIALLSFPFLFFLYRLYCLLCFPSLSGNSGVANGFSFWASVPFLRSARVDTRVGVFACVGVVCALGSATFLCSRTFVVYAGALFSICSSGIFADAPSARCTCLAEGASFWVSQHRRFYLTLSDLSKPTHTEE